MYEPGEPGMRGFSGESEMLPLQTLKKSDSYVFFIILGYRRQKKTGIILKRFPVNGELDLEASVCVGGGRAKKLMRDLVQIVST